MLKRNFFIGLLLISLGANVYLYTENYVNLLPNHPRSPFAHLFPNINFHPALGPDTDQALYNSFLFVVPVEGLPASYSLRVIDRHDCRGASTFSLAAKQPLVLSEYAHVPILVKKYQVSDVSGEEGSLILEKVQVDKVVQEHLDEYKKACPLFALEKF